MGLPLEGKDLQAQFNWGDRLVIPVVRFTFP